MKKKLYKKISQTEVLKGLQYERAFHILIQKNVILKRDLHKDSFVKNVRTLKIKEKFKSF